MAENPRARKIADRIQEITVRALEREVRDPRLGFVTITDVRVTGDLQHASIFYTVYGTDEERDETAKALSSAKGVVRREIGKGLSLRLTPTIEFHLDALPDSAASIDHLLDEARQRDLAAQRAAESAQYAGEPDPYRKPKDADEDESAAS
ncbi:30S ribosome-binding factor RbfA [Agrococcus sp. Marseille-Q4369]|uniref:30S ribosome-binding factor RbfA n=1 Tax=unclassified Agrococcus TaxID=2615065 RepID=UPI001B8CEF60|nr:30S ribosome-binding factor RbfA [Agrococcus sp. Marseille-Q4369]QUW19597.1 30S ribosome-binding factor RbfA [Agrococcus sp. Marseille-Q4369]